MSEPEKEKGLFWQLMDSFSDATGIANKERKAAREAAKLAARTPDNPMLAKLMEEEVQRLDQMRAARELGEMPDPSGLIVNSPYVELDAKTPTELGIGPSADWKRRNDAHMASIADAPHPSVAKQREQAEHLAKQQAYRAEMETPEMRRSVAAEWKKYHQAKAQEKAAAEAAASKKPAKGQ